MSKAIDTSDLENKSKEKLIEIIRVLEKEKNDAKIIHNIITKSGVKVHMLVKGVTPVKSKSYSLLFKCNEEDYNRLNQITPITNKLEDEN